MTLREIKELERGTHPALKVTEEEQRLYLQGRERAEERLIAARWACDAAADLSYEAQAFVTEELLYAEAAAEEWGVALTALIGISDLDRSAT
jgi:hypothetical protein